MLQILPTPCGTAWNTTTSCISLPGLRLQTQVTLTTQTRLFLGRLLAAGTTWTNLVQERIFNVLGMTRSYPTFALVPAAEVPNLSQPYDSSWLDAGKRTMPRLSVDAAAPAG